MDGPKVVSAVTKYIRMTRLAARASHAALRAKRHGHETEWAILKQRTAKLALSALRMHHF